MPHDLKKGVTVEYTHVGGGFGTRHPSWTLWRSCWALATSRKEMNKSLQVMLKFSNSRIREAVNVYGWKSNVQPHVVLVGLNRQWCALKLLGGASICCIAYLNSSAANAPCAYPLLLESARSLHTDDQKSDLMEHHCTCHKNNNGTTSESCITWSIANTYSGEWGKLRIRRSSNELPCN